MIEECTEGSVSMKKCLAGNGSIELESDESAIKEAIDSAKTKKLMIRRKTQETVKGSQENIRKHPVASFVGITLDNRGMITRVHTKE